MAKDKQIQPSPEPSNYCSLFQNLPYSKCKYFVVDEFQIGKCFYEGVAVYEYCPVLVDKQFMNMLIEDNKKHNENLE